MTDSNPVPLIVFSPQREPSEFINSLMRKAGEPVHCTWIPAVRDLGEALEQLNPELLICAYVPDADARQAATVRDQVAPQVPMILVRPQISETDIALGMRLCARDVVPLWTPGVTSGVVFSVQSTGCATSSQKGIRRESPPRERTKKPVTSRLSRCM